MKKSIWAPRKPRFRNHKKKIFQQIIDTGSFIHHIGESEDLRKPSIPVPLAEFSSDEFRSQVQYLKRCMLKYRKLTGLGRGIAGVQVGIHKRMAVIYKPEVEEKLLIIINPKILRSSEKRYEYPEICMSANPLIAHVIRPAWIEFEYLDEWGNLQKWDRKDDTKEGKVYNRVFQHEIDHMNGIINIDLVESKTLVFESDPKFYEKARFKKVT